MYEDEGRKIKRTKTRIETKMGTKALSDEYFDNNKA